jgi:hypothetical protein
MAGILKVDQVQSDSNLAFNIAGSNVAFMTATSLQMVTSNLSLAGTSVITNGKLVNSFMPVGTVLQVVQSVYTTRYTTTSTGSWIAPGMTGSITPSSTSSKILVSVNVVIGNSGGGSTNGATIRLTRNSSAVSYLNRTSAGAPAGTYQSYNGFNSGTMHLEYLDSPSSVSSVTYGVEAWWEAGTNYGTFNTDRDNNSGAQGNATVTMMEIAA